VESWFGLLGVVLWPVVFAGLSVGCGRTGRLRRGGFVAAFAGDRRAWSRAPRWFAVVGGRARACGPFSGKADWGLRLALGCF
jgi:hypothetical protein